MLKELKMWAVQPIHIWNVLNWAEKDMYCSWSIVFVVEGEDEFVMVDDFREIFSRRDGVLVDAAEDASRDSFHCSYLPEIFV